MIKCVVWDIDNTLLAGVYLESAGALPGADDQLAAVVHELASRGILNALASKNPPEAADYVQRLTGARFAAAECGWGSKADAVSRIAADLDLPADAIAFVDDDMIERAEVAAACPDMLVLSPEEAAEAPAWPEFSPAVITAEGRRRGELYAQRRRRQAEAAAFAGSREAFLRHVGTRIAISPATMADLPRLHELSVRTHQLNSAGEPLSEEQFAGHLRAAGDRVTTLALADDFGDDGLVGAAVMTGMPAGTSRAAPVPARRPEVVVPVVMMSCRALGRGALDALLAWLCRSAAAAGAAELRVPCLVTERNVPMRLALSAAGLRADPDLLAADGRAVFCRALAGELPPMPDWVTAR